MEKRMDSAAMILPMFGIGLVLIIWTAISLKVAPDLPSPLQHLARKPATISSIRFSKMAR